MKRRVWIAIGIVVFVLGAVLLRFIPCIISQIIIIYEEAAVTDPAVCEAAAKPLARLCQSDPFFFHDEPVFAPAWLPPAICKLRPSWAKIKPEGATVEFGGGFYHYGYALSRDTAADTPTQNGWKLELYHEDSTDRLLKAFVLEKSDHLEIREFIDQAIGRISTKVAGRWWRIPSSAASEVAAKV